MAPDFPLKNQIKKKTLSDFLFPFHTPTDMQTLAMSTMIWSFWHVLYEGVVFWSDWEMLIDWRLTSTTATSLLQLFYHIRTIWQCIPMFTGNMYKLRQTIHKRGRAQKKNEKKRWVKCSRLKHLKLPEDGLKGNPVVPPCALSHPSLPPSPFLTRYLLWHPSLCTMHIWYPCDHLYPPSGFFILPSRVWKCIN